MMRAENSSRRSSRSYFRFSSGVFIGSWRFDVECWMFRGVEDFSWIKQAVRIERVFDRFQQRITGVAELLTEKTFLREAHAMFAGDRAAEAQGFVEDLFH